MAPLKVKLTDSEIRKIREEIEEVEVTGHFVNELGGEFIAISFVLPYHGTNIGSSSDDYDLVLEVIHLDVSM